MRCVDASSPSTTVRSPAPPGTIRPANPPTTPVDAVPSVYTLPFIVLETGASEKSYEFSVASTTEVSVSLTGMDRDIDCNVNGRRCTNRGGTADDSWSGTLHAGRHTVTVYPYGGGSGSWTLGVGGKSTSPPPAPPPPPSPPGSPQPTCPTGYTYVASPSRCERSQSFRMRAIETGISSQQSYSFTLRSSSSVTVSLTGLTRDFDCTVGNSNCTNNWGSADDSWSGTLGAGTHTVLVYPYGDGGPGDYTLTVAVNDVSLVSIAQPFGAPDTEDDETCRLDGEEIECPTPDETLDVVGEPEEPEGTTPPDTDPPPETPDPDPPPTTTSPSDVIGSLKDVVEATKLDCRGMNFALDDRLGSTHGGGSTTRPEHGGIDIQTMGRHSNFYAPVGGTLRYLDQNGGCGHHARITRADGSWVTICHLDPAHDVDPGPVAAGTDRP